MDRLRWRVRDAWDVCVEAALDVWGSAETKLVVGLLAVALLAGGGFVAARNVAASNTGTSGLVPIETTVRVPVTVREHGRTVVRYRLRRKTVLANPQTVLSTRIVHGRLVTRQVVRYRVRYRKHVVTAHGKTRTVATPVTATHVATQTLTQYQTDTATETRTTTQTRTTDRTVTQPTTVRVTTTVVTTTIVTTTVTEPGTTVTTTSPGTTASG